MREVEFDSKGYRVFTATLRSKDGSLSESFGARRGDGFTEPGTIVMNFNGQAMFVEAGGVQALLEAITEAYIDSMERDDE